MISIKKRADGYHRQFKVYNKACMYLINRGFTDDSSREFIIKDNYLGLSMEDKNDFYYGYLVFPIFDLSHNIVSFTSRSILDEVKPTHKHWKGTIDYFYNHNDIKLKKYNTQKSSYIIITESPLDTLSLLYSGYYSIATMGSSRLPTLYADLLNTKHIIIIFDADSNNVGQSKAKTLASKLHSVCDNISLGHIDLPSGLKKIDINDLFRQDKTTDKSNFKDQINNIVNKA